MLNYGQKMPYSITVCGDIQAGDGQTLRFNLNEDNFFDKYAPELNSGLGIARDFSFTATPWEGDE